MTHDYHDLSAGFLEAYTDCWWTLADEERATSHDLDEAIEEYLDEIDPADWPAAVEMKALRPMDVRGTLRPRDFATDALTLLDEEYGDPEGDGPEEPTVEMVEAAEAFIRVVESGYRSWACEEVALIRIDVHRWVAEHRPNWVRPETRTEP